MSDRLRSHVVRPVPPPPPRLPVEQRRGYTNVFNSLFRITHEEGVLMLWRGCGPTVVGAMVVNAAQLASYVQAKQMLLATSRLSFLVGLVACPVSLLSLH